MRPLRVVFVEDLTKEALVAVSGSLKSLLSSSLAMWAGLTLSIVTVTALPLMFNLKVLRLLSNTLNGPVYGGSRAPLAGPCRRKTYSAVARSFGK